jgi:hypothetical protein
MGLYRGNYEVSKAYRGNIELSKIYRGNTEVWSATSPGITDISTFSYNSALSYTGDSYPGSRYGGTFSKPKIDGSRIFWTYADYNYHRDNYADLSTPWDFSTIGTQVASGNYDLTNHYQTTWWISQDGTKVFTGGYSNSNVGGYDDIYRKDLSTAWVNTGDSYTTYGTNPRSYWGAHTNYKMLGFNPAGTTWIMGGSNDAAGTNVDYRKYLRQYSLSTAWDQSNTNVTQVNFFDLGAHVGITSYYSGGTGEICNAYTMNYSGTQILLDKITYSGGTITSRKFMVGNMSTPFDISTLTVDTTKYIDLASLPITASFNIADVFFGGDNQEYLIVYVGNGSYGQSNGVKMKWLVYK